MYHYNIKIHKGYKVIRCDDVYIVMREHKWNKSFLPMNAMDGDVCAQKAYTFLLYYSVFCIFGYKASKWVRRVERLYMYEHEHV